MNVHAPALADAHLPDEQTSIFAKEAVEDLSQHPKRLSPKYFYDSAGSDLFEHVLVDLTGFELLGEHASAAACMDAVALVGRAHNTREKELLELARLMPRGRFFGILLVGLLVGS